MIVTVTTVVVMVVGLLSLALAMYGGFISSTIIDDLGKENKVTQKTEHKYYLLGMIGIIVLAARIIIVPIFFWMLQSLVPYCPGAMCASGVINVSNPYSTISLFMKLLVPFVYGSWLLLEVSNRREPTLPLLRQLTKSFLLLLLPLLVADSTIDILLTATIRPVYAPCCSSIYDTNPPFSPSSILGPQFGMLIVFLTVSITLALAILQLVKEKRFFFQAALLALAALASILYLITIHDTLAPMALGLPNHHCPYCLFQEYPDTAMFAGLFWIGVSSAGWSLILDMVWQRKGLDGRNISGITSVLRRVSAYALLFSMVSLVSHLLVAI